ncbi:RNA polymerase II complex component [Heterostelium album PN500]|uniref:RNA polymerase II complex component n=1 Tax=Heterostelium pallidum (strain ATCC 26659 / Pp 5 / PN500) TaxID=670386 RepID=D3BE55_HETP5|nr:RNA polymerase II complex component [Heterostelium album PN500]EFA80186.1 RNA polymerase II complex component [Heterostelium album PN500]|eukprot:XP_020432306.1 RNA polymerase II complex component [Heterostelium album PN500]
MSDVEFGSDEDDIVSTTTTTTNNNNKVNNNYSDKEDDSDIDRSQDKKRDDSDNDEKAVDDDEQQEDEPRKKKKESKEERRERKEKRRREKEAKRRRNRGEEDDAPAEDEDEDDIAEHQSSYSSSKSRVERDSEYGYDDGMAEGEEEEEKDVIGPPINLVHINKDPLPRRSKLMKLKVLNILGIQPQPFSIKTFNEDEPVERRKSNVESVIRWRWGVGEGGVEMKESNTRFVRWEDGSSHLFIGNEVLEVKEHELGGDHIYIYSSQDGFLECEGKLDSRLNIRPTDITSKVHRRLAESATSRSKKVGRIKTIQTTIDPEKDKEAKERFEAEIIRSRRLKENKVKSHAEKIGLDSKYLTEGQEQDEDSGYGYSNEDRFINDDEEDDDYYDEEDEDEEYDEEEGSSMDEFIDNSPASKKSSHKRSRNDDSERTKKLMKIKQSSSSKSSSSSSSNNIFGDDSEEEEPVRNNRGGSKSKAIIDD